MVEAVVLCCLVEGHFPTVNNLCAMLTYMYSTHTFSPKRDHFTQAEVQVMQIRGACPTLADLLQYVSPYKEYVIFSNCKPLVRAKAYLCDACGMQKLYLST